MGTLEWSEDIGQIAKNATLRFYISKEKIHYNLLKRGDVTSLVLGEDDNVQNACGV